MTAFARNQWYVAAYSREIDRGLFSRTICGEPVVFWRTRTATVTALAGLCAHRRFPLSQRPTQLVDDQVVCGYHGFTYDRRGRCVAVPGQVRIPARARLAEYPCVEQDSLVWIFIGDEERADVASIPRAPWLNSKVWTTVRGMEPLAARAGLLVDNLMDLSHETYLHGGYIGTPEVATTPITTEVDEDAAVVYVSRHMDDAECPPFYSRSTGLGGRIARWQDIEFVPPCLYKLHSRIAPVGSRPAEDGADQDAFHVEVVYAITPETETSTHDFWAVSRDFALDDQAVSDFLAEQNRTVVLQDVVALNSLEQSLQSTGRAGPEVSVKIDTGGLAARRIIGSMMAGDDGSPVRTGTAWVTS